MSSFHYEGDILGLRKPQLDVISKILDKKGFKKPKVIIEPVGKAGDNYIANVKRIVVEENGETFKMVAKVAPENHLTRKMVNVEMLFQNEHIMYTEVFPKFDLKQENERFKFAKCYGSFNEAPNEVILLEDLKESDFVILDRFEPLTCENVKIVLKNLAIYHALSFAIRYQEPETFEAFQKRFAPNLEMNFFSEQATEFNNRLEEEIIEIVDDRCKKHIKGTVINSPKYDVKIRKFINDSKYTVIQQGDGWTSNIIFRYENKVPVKVKVKALNNFGLKANFVYPRDKLDTDLKIYGKHLFALTLVMTNIITKNKKEAERMKEAMEMTDGNDAEKGLDLIMMRDQESVKRLKNKVEDLADSFSEFGLL